MNKEKQELARKIYLYLAALFITSLVVSNLIFQKFFYWYPFEMTIGGIKLFELSVGILPYPITFLVTDLISEIYGQKKANQVVVAGIFASFFSISIILISDLVPAIPSSPIDDQTFSNVFSLSGLAVLASMLAYLFAQFIDIKIYHFWKKLTNGKMLWLRNNGSTIFSQLIDTILVVVVLFFGVKSLGEIGSIIFDGWLFKVICALIDTPIIYVSVFLIRKYFKLAPGEEVQF